MRLLDVLVSGGGLQYSPCVLALWKFTCLLLECIYNLHIWSLWDPWGPRWGLEYSMSCNKWIQGGVLMQMDRMEWQVVWWICRIRTDWSLTVPARMATTSPQIRQPGFARSQWTSEPRWGNYFSGLIYSEVCLGWETSGEPSRLRMTDFANFEHIIFAFLKRVSKPSDFCSLILCILSCDVCSWLVMS